MLAVALTAAALAAPVPVTGGTAGQRAVVRRLLSHADPGAITSARIDARGWLVLGGAKVRAPSERYGRALWEGQVLGGAAVSLLAERGEALAGYEVGGGALGIPYHGPPKQERLNLGALERLRERVLARARAAGLAVRSARVLRIGAGGLDVTVRLREDQLLDSDALGALTTLFGPASQTAAISHFLAVEEPGGTAAAYGGAFEGAGSWSYGGETGDAPVPRTVPEQVWRLRTDVVVALVGGIGQAKTHTFHIVCGGSEPAPGSRCRRLLADRWSLLVPTVGFTCAGGPARWEVSVRGTFAGRAVSRDYSNCYSPTGERWARFLGLPASR